MLRKIVRQGCFMWGIGRGLNQFFGEQKILCNIFWLFAAADP
jgi:hypothetical protein